MGMNKSNKIQKIVSEAAQRGHDVTIRNIAYALMRVYFDDKLPAYTVVHGAPPEKDSDVDDYDNMEQVQYLIRVLETEIAPSHKDDNSADIIAKAIADSTKSVSASDDLISFDENYAGAVAQLQRIEDLRNRCDPDDIKTLKDLEKAESDLRVRLVDKFNVQEKTQEKWIVVPRVFNYVCPWTHHECYQIGREEAMEKWHLIPDPKHKD